MDEEITKVIFRRWANGDVIALFPEIAATVGNPSHCLSYSRVGEHGAADLLGLTYKLKLATPAEYADTLVALTRRGYRLKVIKRVTRAMFQARRAQLKG